MPVSTYVFLCTLVMIIFIWRYPVGYWVDELLLNSKDTFKSIENNDDTFVTFLGTLFGNKTNSYCFVPTSHLDSHFQGNIFLRNAANKRISNIDVEFICIHCTQLKEGTRVLNNYMVYKPLEILISIRNGIQLQVHVVDIS